MNNYKKIVLLLLIIYQHTPVLSMDSSIKKENTSSLEILPPELIVLIGSFLKPLDLLHLSQSNTLLRHLMNPEFLKRIIKGNLMIVQHPPCPIFYPDHTICKIIKDKIDVTITQESPVVCIRAHSGTSSDWYIRPPAKLDAPFLHYIPFCFIKNKKEGDILALQYNNKLLRLRCSQRWGANSFEDILAMEMKKFKIAPAWSLAPKNTQALLDKDIIRKINRSNSSQRLRHPNADYEHGPNGYQFNE
jgi:hypothetical protein